MSSMQVAFGRESKSRDLEEEEESAWHCNTQILRCFRYAFNNKLQLAIGADVLSLTVVKGKPR